MIDSINPTKEVPEVAFLKKERRDWYSALISL